MPDLPTGTVTLLFTDIEGSTQLLQRLGPQYGDVLAEYRALLRSIFQAHGGQVVDAQGDSFFVAFPRALDAVQAAVEIQRAVVSHPWPEGVTMATRMGLHTGEPQQGNEGYVGLDVHRAARIGAAGHGGQILLSNATHAIVAHDLPEGVSLRDLGEHRIKDLRHPRRLWQLVIPGLPSDFPPLKTLNSRPNSLPVQRDPLIGREREVATVAALLHGSDVGLVTLTGTGGSGKTRLALQVAADFADAFADGGWFVDLAPVSDPALVASTIAQVLGVKDVAGQSITATLKPYLRDKHLLLVLDNFEQLLPAAPLLTDLLAAAPYLKLLVTSREVLHLSGEHEYPVPPLALPDLRRSPALDTLKENAAVTLFTQRARAVKPDFQVTKDTAHAVAEICVRLDGLPLALELAAARVKLFTPRALLARLDKRLTLLTGGARDRVARQQTLRGAIDWSYNLLDQEEQLYFSRMGVFVGGCPLEAIEAVCNTPSALGSDVLDTVVSLVDQSLVQQREGAYGEPRFTMLETIREYALERLAASGEAPMLQQRHAVYFRTLAAAAEQAHYGPRGGTALQHLAVELDNLRAALRWAIDQADSALAQQICGSLEVFWVNRAPTEGLEWLDRVLALGPAPHTVPVATAAWARTLTAAGYVVASHGDNLRAEGYFQQSLVACREVGDPASTGLALRGLGFLATQRAEFPRARAYIEESLALCGAAQDEAGIAYSLYDLGHLAYSEGDLARAEALLQDSLSRFQGQGNQLGLGRALLSLGHVARAQGQLEWAKTHYRASLVEHQQAGYVGFTALALEGLAGVAATQGRAQQAARLFGAAEAARAALGVAMALSPHERASVDGDVAVARAHLDPTTWNAAWAEGEAMTLEQAIAYALEEGLDD